MGQKKLTHCMQNLWTGCPLADFRMKIREASPLYNKHEQFRVCEASEHTFSPNMKEQQ
jgi:hypothetical protein